MTTDEREELVKGGNHPNTLQESWFPLGLSGEILSLRCEVGMRTFLLIPVIFFLSISVFAQGMQKFQPVETDIESGDRIVIRGYQGDIKVTGGNSNKLIVQGMKPKTGDFSQWNFRLRKAPGVVEIIVKGPSETEDWEKVRAGNVPRFSLNLSAPSRPLTVSWQEGNIEVLDWEAPATIHSTKGKVKTKKGKGGLNIQLMNGDIVVDSQEGNIQVQTRIGKVFVKNSKGRMTIDNYSSTYQVTNHKGGVDVQNYSGKMTLVDMEGQFNFNNNLGNFTLSGLKGSVKGESAKGVISVRAKQIQDFVVNSHSGPVVLDLPKEAGAYVSIRSEKGNLRGAPHFAKLRKGRWTELRGKLRGKEPGQVKIVSKYGNIVVK